MLDAHSSLAAGRLVDVTGEVGSDSASISILPFDDETGEARTFRLSDDTLIDADIAPHGLIVGDEIVVTFVGENAATRLSRLFRAAVGEVTTASTEALTIRSDRPGHELWLTGSTQFGDGESISPYDSAHSTRERESVGAYYLRRNTGDLAVRIVVAD